MLFEIFRLSIPDLQPGNSISLAVVQDEQLNRLTIVMVLVVFIQSVVSHY